MTKQEKPIEPSTSDTKQIRTSNAAAYERGADAGKQRHPKEGNPYPEGSGAAKSFEHGQLDAQKIRSNDKPPGR
ncbi:MULTISPECIES: Sf3a2-prov protein [unclassified Rhizobium]|uniref:Sf3a2-prov protein n=1 Tax=unclassified Rhizobium TaxID=2613769 RepID=UPI0018EAFE63